MPKHVWISEKDAYTNTYPSVANKIPTDLIDDHEFNYDENEEEEIKQPSSNKQIPDLLPF